MNTSNGFQTISRRAILKTASCGFGYLALAGLAAETAKANPLAPRAPHFAPRAKRVIFLFMRGGPSHVDLFDPKPLLNAEHGKPLTRAITNTLDKKTAPRILLGSPWKFAQHGQSGLPISELLPNLSQHADDLCVVRGMHTDLPSHPEAVVQLHTGSFQFVRPSMGAWVLYGLGTENQNLPGFITLCPTPKLGGAQNYGNAFLPAAYQATRIGQEGVRVSDAGIEHIANVRLSRRLQRRQLDLVQAMNQRQLERDQSNHELEGVIESYELAFRMQSAAPELMDLDNETQSTLDAYGIGNKATDDFGRQCLLARRFIEAGVRFVEIASADWDHHAALRKKLPELCQETDQPIAALIADLKARGLFEDTLLVWGGEFGRTPYAQNEDGRDHNASGYTMWLAGGGAKGGATCGETDEYGMAAVDGKVHIHDLHATILHLLGLDHEQLTYRYSGRDFRLTDVHGRLVPEIVA